MFAEMYGKMSGHKGKGRSKRGRPVALRAQTERSVEHGGHTGHFAGARRGPHAAMPHHGGHTGGTRPGYPMQGGGFIAGPHAASPHRGHHTGPVRPGHPMQGRGFQGGLYAASPHNGMVAGRGQYTGTRSFPE